jgi:hypothetical protein
MSKEAWEALQKANTEFENRAKMVTNVEGNRKLMEDIAK